MFYYIEPGVENDDPKRKNGVWSPCHDPDAEDQANHLGQLNFHLIEKENLR